MKAQESEWVSVRLDAAGLRGVLELLPDLLKELLGDAFFVAMYGWGCNLHMDLCYVPMKVGTSLADQFIKDSLEQRIFMPVESDLYFEVPDDRLRILFCHEGDTHVSGPDDELRDKIFHSEPFRRLSFSKHRKKG